MLYQFSFEKLSVWKDSKELVKMIYNITKDFPEQEKFGLTDQLRRASISIASNLAEGTSRRTGKDKIQFTTLSYSSLMEVLNQLIIAKELDFLKEDSYAKIRKLITKTANKLNILRKTQID